MIETFSHYLDTIGEVGVVDQVLGSVVYVSGIPKVKPREVVLFESGQFGEAQFLYEQYVEVLLFNNEPLRVGTRVVRTDQLVSIPVGSQLLGKTIDALGRVIRDGQNSALPQETRTIESAFIGIDRRVPVHRQLETGVTIVDMLVPLGKGQRELIIGDRKTGKTSFVLQTTLNQARQGAVCIYTAVGKKHNEINLVEEFFEKAGVRENIVIISSTPNGPAPLVYIAPYAGMALAEYFRDQGKDVLLVLDDMSIHAKFARELALSARRFPGRDSYPVDIFYTHARLMERAGNFKSANGEVSITALPIMETAMGDLSGYTQTNMMSMTDGHVYFDTNLFQAGQRPSVNPFYSVTRVGRQAQTRLRQNISRELVGFLTYYEKMKSFVHFGAELSDSAKKTLAKGERMNAFLDQRYPTILVINIQLFQFALLWRDRDDPNEPFDAKEYMKKIDEAYTGSPSLQSELDTLIANTQELKVFVDVSFDLAKKYSLA
jgi:F-type H+-transporting ATPase subunit alpha